MVSILHVFGPSISEYYHIVFNITDHYFCSRFKMLWQWCVTFRL